MSKTNIYLKIYYTEPDALPMKVIAVVEESQFYSLENSFISILNYSDKIINKYDITKITMLEEAGEIDPTLIRTKVYHPLKAKV